MLKFGRNPSKRGDAHEPPAISNLLQLLSFWLLTSALAASAFDLVKTPRPRTIARPRSSPRGSSTSRSGAGISGRGQTGSAGPSMFSGSTGLKRLILARAICMNRRGGAGELAARGAAWSGRRSQRWLFPDHGTIGGIEPAGLLAFGARVWSCSPCLDGAAVSNAGGRIRSAVTRRSTSRQRWKAADGASHPVNGIDRPREADELINIGSEFHRDHPYSAGRASKPSSRTTASRPRSTARGSLPISSSGYVVGFGEGRGLGSAPI